MRRTAIATAIILIGSLVATAPAVARTGSARPPTATITVVPSTDLTSGQTVHVSGAGFTPNAGLASAECKAGAVSVSDCDLSSPRFPRADDTGAYSFDTDVLSTLNTGNGAVDCTASDGACVIAVAESLDLTGTEVTAPLSFAPLGPPQRGVLHVPPAPVAAYSSVEVKGTDFAPFAVIETAICAAGATDANDCADSFGVNADASGAIDFSLYPGETLETKNGQSIDCTVDGACVYAGWDFRDFAATLSTARVRLAPEVAGTLAVDPSTGLHDGDQVTVSGSGWPADTYLTLLQCNGTTDTATCSNNFGYATTDGHGAFSTPYTVQSVSDTGPYLNCETGPCWLVAAWYAPNSVVTASQPLSFDSTTTPVTSHYTAAEMSAVTGAATTLGVSNAEEQHVGAWALAWVLAITGTDHITPAPDSGPGTLTTEWLPTEYRGMNAYANSEGATLPEFQKTGALFLAYILALP